MFICSISQVLLNLKPDRPAPTPLVCHGEGLPDVSLEYPVLVADVVPHDGLPVRVTLGLALGHGTFEWF